MHISFHCFKVNVMWNIDCILLNMLVYKLWRIVLWRGVASRGETKRDITAGRLTQGAVNRAGAGPIDTARDSPAL